MNNVLSDPTQISNPHQISTKTESIQYAYATDRKKTQISQRTFRNPYPNVHG